MALDKKKKKKEILCSRIATWLSNTNNTTQRMFNIIFTGPYILLNIEQNGIDIEELIIFLWVSIQIPEIMRLTYST